MKILWQDIIRNNKRASASLKPEVNSFALDGWEVMFVEGQVQLRVNIFMKVGGRRCLLKMTKYWPLLISLFIDPEDIGWQEQKQDLECKNFRLLSIVLLNNYLIYTCKTKIPSKVINMQVRTGLASLTIGEKKSFYCGKWNLVTAH